MKNKFKIVLLLVTVMCLALSFACTKPDDSSDKTEWTVTISRKTVQLDRFGEATLTAESNSSELVWNTSNGDIVAVSDGKITAMGVGEATVTVTVKNTDVFDSCAVTVNEPADLPVLTLNKSEIAIVEGATLKVVPSLSYRSAAAEGAAFTFAIDDAQIATVSADGTVTGVKAGEAILEVKASWHGAEFVKSISVRVNPDASVSIKNGDEIVSEITLRTSLPDGCDESYVDEITLSATVYEGGDIVENGTVEWTATNDCVTVENGKISAVKVGDAVVKATYATSSGKSVYAEISVTVVLPDVSVSQTIGADKTDALAPIDFSAITKDAVTAVYCDKLNILSGDHINADWLVLQKDGDYEIQIATASVVYNAKLSVYARYMQVDMANTGIVNIVNENGGNQPLCELWNVPSAEEMQMLGVTENILKYNLTENAAGFGRRIEINNLTGNFAGYIGYVVFEIYVPEGNVGAGLWGKNTGDIWYDLKVGATLDGAKGYYIGSDGVKTNVLKSDEWMTVVLNVGGTFNVNRFALMTPGGVATQYFVHDFRLYSESRFDVPCLTKKFENIRLEAGKTIEIKASDFATNLGKTATVADKLVLSCESDFVSIENGIITGIGSGDAEITATLYFVRTTFDVKFKVSVVEIPTIDSSEKLTVEKTSGNFSIDFAKITSDAVTSVKEGETEILSDGKFDKAWVMDHEEGEFTVQFYTENAIYNVKVVITAKYATVDLGDASKVNVVTGGKGNLALGNMWSVATDEEKSTIGASGNVYKYYLGTDTGASFYNRVEINNFAALTKNHYGYVVYKVFVPVGFPSSAAWGKSNVDVWLNHVVGGTFYADRGCFINSNGVKTQSLKAGEWTTVVIYAKSKNINRFAFMSPGGQATTYYISDIRFYAENEWLDFYLDSAAAEKKVKAGETIEITAADFATKSGVSATAATTIEISSTSDLITIENNVVTGVSAGKAVVNVTLTYGDQTVVTTITVEVTEIAYVDATEKFTFEKTSDNFEADFGKITTETITSVKEGETEILSDGKFDKAWIMDHEEGEFTVQFYTENAIYNVKVVITAKYATVDLGDASKVNVVTGGKGNLALGNMWSVATDEEKSTIGASGNVYKYYLSANGDSFSNRVEINNFMSVAGSHYGYVVYKVFIPDGQTGAAAFGKTSSGVNVWCDMYVGGTLNTGRGCLIGADGIKTSSARTGEWMTSVIYVKSTQSSRFCFMAPGGKATTYYVKDIRFYAEEEWLDFYLDSAAAEKKVKAGETIEITAADIPVYCGKNKVSSLDSIVLTCESEAVTVSGSSFTASTAGSYTVIATVKSGEKTFTFNFAVTVNAESTEE